MSSSISAAVFADFESLGDKHSAVGQGLREACAEANIVPLVAPLQSEANCPFGRYAMFCGDVLLMSKPSVVPRGVILDTILDAVSRVISARPMRFETIKTEEPSVCSPRIEFSDLVEIGAKYICNGRDVARSAPALQAFLDQNAFNRSVEIIKDSPLGRRLRDCVVQVGSRVILASEWAQEQAAIQRLVESGFSVLELPEGESAANVLWFRQRDGEALLVSAQSPKTRELLMSSPQVGARVVPVELSTLGSSCCLADLVLKASFSDS